MEGCSAPINVKLAETLESKREKKRMSLELAQYGLFPQSKSFYYDHVSKDNNSVGCLTPSYPSTKTCGRYIIPPAKEQIGSMQNNWNSCDNISSLSNSFENSIKDFVVMKDSERNYAPGGPVTSKYQIERPNLIKRNSIDGYPYEQTKKQITGPTNANLIVYNLPVTKERPFFLLSLTINVDFFSQFSESFQRL